MGNNILTSGQAKVGIPEVDPLCSTPDFLQWRKVYCLQSSHWLKCTNLFPSLESSMPVCSGCTDHHHASRSWTLLYMWKKPFIITAHNILINSIIQTAELISLFAQLYINIFLQFSNILHPIILELPKVTQKFQNNLGAKWYDKTRIKVFTSFLISKDNEVSIPKSYCLILQREFKCNCFAEAHLTHHVLRVHHLPSPPAYVLIEKYLVAQCLPLYLLRNQNRP